MNIQTEVRQPSERASEEGDEPGLLLAREQGQAFQRTLEHLARDIVRASGKTRAGEYLLAYGVEEAEGLYLLRDAKLQWCEPHEENVHIEIAVCDAADMRFVPGLDVHVSLYDSDGGKIGSHRHPLLWHPYLYHYGRNWRVDAEGDYRLHVRIDPPDFHVMTK